jgi:tetratricopeptide (TPR) repeat protein
VPTLSVCLIVKNEEAHLARCLASVRALADEIVVVDTGSTDRTVDVARSFGARLFDLVWPDDFSAARNFAIAQAAGDWILSIDADESIALRDHARIRTMLSRPDLDVIVVSQRHYLTASAVVGWQPGSGGYDEGAPYPGFLDIGCARLFRNRPWLRFRNRVHEEIASTDPARTVAWGRGEWVIHHYGKVGDSDLLRAKAEAYLKLGMAKAAEHPDDPQAHYELGVQYFELDQAAAALASFERVLGTSRGTRSGTTGRAFDDTHLRIAMCHRRLGQPAQALAALRLAALAVPQRVAEIALEEGNAHRALGDDVEAERAYRRAIAAKPGLAAAHFNLGLTHERQNRLAQALATFDRAVDLDPAHAESRMQRARIRRKTGDDAGALEDLERLGAHGAASCLRARILLQQGRVAEAHDALIRASGDVTAEIAGLLGAVAIGRGEVDEAVRQLRRSLDLGPTYEAARNLSAALEARGDGPGALGAAAEALRLKPADEIMLARVAALEQDLRCDTRSATDEPANVDRVAVHLLAGRAALAQRMIDRAAAPAGLEEPWQALRAFVAWRAGGGEPPLPGQRQLLASHFKSLRRAGVLDPDGSSTP